LNKALKQFHNSELPFEINLLDQLSDQVNFELNDLISCFNAVDFFFDLKLKLFEQKIIYMFLKISQIFWIKEVCPKPAKLLAQIFREFLN
jgi:hypothetical protein